MPSQRPPDVQGQTIAVVLLVALIAVLLGSAALMGLAVYGLTR